MSYNTCGAPVLDNYAQAKEWHDNTKPIRGNADKVRPLGSRRHWQMGSIAMDGDDVVLKYYGHKAVVWHPDDSLDVYMPRWCTAFEPDKMAHFLPSTLSFEWNRRRLVLFNQVDQTRVQIVADQPVKLEAIDVIPWGYGTRLVRKFKIAEIPQTYRYAKRRGVAPKLVKQKFGAFIDWVATVQDISPKVTHEEGRRAADFLFFNSSGVTMKRWNKAVEWNSKTAWGPDEEQSKRKLAFSDDNQIRENYPLRGANDWRARTHFHYAGVVAIYNMMLEDNQDQWYSALQIIAMRDGERQWESGGVYYNFTLASVQRYLEKIVCVVHRDDVFERVALDAGTIGSKNHLEFFNGSELQFFENSDNESVISV